MTVRVNKPPIDLRSKLSELERPTGLKGNELMRAETAQEARDLVSAGRKNALYNGDMQIWQRGTTFNNSGAGGAVNYTADRWNSTRYASTENDTTREDANYLGFRYCLRSARSNGDTTTTARYVHQVLEQKDTWKLRGNYVTFSYYARVGSGFNGGFLGTYMTYHTDSAREERFYYNQFINGNNSYAYITHYDISTEWKRYSFTRFLPDNAQQIGVSIGSNQNLPTSTGGDYFEITGCQLEVGKNATDFEHRSYGEELALCQRYCYVIRGDWPAATAGVVLVGNGVWNGTSNAYIKIQHPVTMLKVPSIDYGNLGWYRVVAEAVSWRGISSLSLLTDSCSINSTTINVTATTDTRGLVARMTTQTTSARLILSSEL
jgi:hypothetical protein